jgi:hypothetical protein
MWRVFPWCLSPGRCNYCSPFNAKINADPSYPVNLWFSRQVWRGPTLWRRSQGALLWRKSDKPVRCTWDTDMQCTRHQYEDVPLDFQIDCRHEVLCVWILLQQRINPFKEVWTTTWYSNLMSTSSMTGLFVLSIKESCAVTINDDYCQSCTLCSAVNAWVKADCSIL